MAVAISPDPFAEIRLRALHGVRGPNYWSRRPVTRLDVDVGAYEEIHSADVPGLPEALLAALPGLIEHRCSIGERGGFLARLHRGTYAPHITEHVALELQIAIGHDVGFGRTRGGDATGEYTLVFEHRHEGVGLRAAALALELVQRAFAGQLTPDGAAPALAELSAIAESPDAPPLRQRVLCGISGGGARGAARAAVLRQAAHPAWARAWRLATLGDDARGVRASDLVVDVSPAYTLAQGLPYACSALAIVLDAAPTDVPPRWREPDRARMLVSVALDAVDRDGIAILPADEPELQERARDRGCRVAVFSADRALRASDERLARAAAWVEGDRIALERLGERADGGPLLPDVDATAQVAGALAVFTLRELAGVDDSVTAGTRDAAGAPHRRRREVTGD